MRPQESESEGGSYMVLATGAEVGSAIDVWLVMKSTQQST